MRVLNLYSGIGGNRKYWTDCDITAVEIDAEIAKVYGNLYPQDVVVVGDAHDYLEKHYREYDFIWSSPPCPSHGQYRHNVGVLGKGFSPIMPDMSLYAEIVFLQSYFMGIWVVENVRPYYEPLVKPTFILHRHLFWANFFAPQKDFQPSKIRTKNKISDFEGSDAVAKSKISNKRQVLRNCVNSELGLYLFQIANAQDKNALPLFQTKGLEA